MPVQNGKEVSTVGKSVVEKEEFLAFFGKRLTSVDVRGNLWSSSRTNGAFSQNKQAANASR